MRLAIHTDQLYLRDEGGISTARNFVEFLGEVATHCEHAVVLGRLRRESGRAAHPLPDGLHFAPLPDRAGGANLRATVFAIGPSLRAVWTALDDADVLWLIGPNLLSLPFAGIAAVRGRRIVLGVRQDLPDYVRSRRPGSARAAWAARMIDSLFRAIARRVPVVVVGPGLARRYRRAARLHEAVVSVVRTADVVSPRSALARPWPPRPRLLSVTRLDAEKNPLLLVDVIARLPARWRLTICGDGPMASALADRIAALGLGERVDLPGQVVGDPLVDLYRGAQAFLHVSWTEGVPQVLYEAFAAGTPVVGTAVGGVPGAAGRAAVLVPPGDAEAAAEAVLALESDHEERGACVLRGLAKARRHSLEWEAQRTATFLADQCTPATRRADQPGVLRAVRATRSGSGWSPWRSA